jgi:ABC-2 type transport system ATP-binding protein
LVIQDLFFSFHADKPVLKGVTLEVLPGTKHGLLGANGAGKTTLFRLLAGWIPLQKGTILWEDKPLDRDQVSILEAELFFYPYMTGHEYLRFLRDDIALIAQWNILFDLPLDYIAAEYSTGMQKKLAFMGVLLQTERPLLILDEPFNGVDFESNEKMMAVLNHEKLQSRTMLISSHILPTLTRVCDRVSVLRNGTIERTYERSEFPELETTVQAGAHLAVQDAMRAM